MKSIDDARRSLSNEVDKWFTDQIHNLYSDFFLWYRDASHRNGGAICISNTPPNSDVWLLARPEPLSKALDKQQTFNALNEVLNRLPVINS